MTARTTTAYAPDLEDPGHGRTWQATTGRGIGKRVAWRIALVSRTGTLLGVISQSDIGWSATTRSPSGKIKTAGWLSYDRPQQAADALLKARGAR